MSGSESSEIVVGDTPITDTATSDCSSSDLPYLLSNCTEEQQNTFISKNEKAHTKSFISYNLIVSC